MKTILKALALLPVLTLLAGCPGKPPEPTAQPAAAAAPWDGVKKDEQRARDVHKLVDQQAAQQRAQLDAADK